MIRLIMVEINSTYAEWLLNLLNQSSSHETWNIEPIPSINSEFAFSKLVNADAILLDIGPAPANSNLSILTQLQNLSLPCPIIALINNQDNQLGSHVIQLGAQDYLVKESFDCNELIHTIRHAIDSKRAELVTKRRAQELEALYKTSLEINAQIDLPTLLQSLIERAVNLMGLPLGGLYLVQPDNKSLVLSYSVNLKKDYRGTVLLFGEGVSGRVAQTGRPLAVANYQEWEGRASAYAGSEFKRVLAVPLMVGGKVIGVINLGDDRNNGNWNNDDLRLASLFADQAAIAVQNASLLDRERKKSAELIRSNSVIAALSQITTRLSETLELPIILETLGNELKSLDIFVGLLLFEGAPNPELVLQYISVDRKQILLLETTLEQRLAGLHASPEIRLLADQMISERKGKFHADPIPAIAQKFSAIPRAKLETALMRVGISRQSLVLLLPLFIKDHPLGMMILWGGDLREGDLTTFTMFANQVAVALENARLYNRIERLATLDELTGLYNRRGFFLLAEQQLKMAQRTGTEMLLIFCDVDQLKQINDTLGHREGDRALILTAEVLRTTFRSADILARISGDEFAILAYASPSVGAQALMERLRREVERVNAYSEKPFVLGLSGGYSLWSPSHPANLDELLAQADAQMYRVKRKKITGELNPNTVSQ